MALPHRPGAELMEKDDQRNLLLALVLCLGLFLGYNMLVLEPQAKAAQEARARAQATEITNPSPVEQLRPRDEIVARDIASGGRVAIDATSIDG